VEVGQNPQRREFSGIEVVVSMTVAYPQAGTIPQSEVSLYGGGAEEGIGYVFHLMVFMFSLWYDLREMVRLITEELKIYSAFKRTNVKMSLLEHNPSYSKSD
jgi:hypothetical protein